MRDPELDALLGREIERLRRRIVAADDPSASDLKQYGTLLVVRQRLERQPLDPQTRAALVGPQADEGIASPAARGLPTSTSRLRQGSAGQAGLRGAGANTTTRKEQVVSNEHLEIAGESVALYYGSDGLNQKPRKERQVRLPDFLARLSRQVTTETPLLPEGARWYRRSGNREVVVIETFPHVRTIRYRATTGEQRNLSLAFPYLVTCVVADYGVLVNQTSRVYVRTAPLQTEQDDLALLPLTHVKGFDRYSTVVPPGTICFLTAEKRDIRGGTLAENVATLFSRFWDTTFEGWIWGEGAMQTGDARLRSMDAWAEASADDPLFVLEAGWPAAWPLARTTLADAVGGLLAAAGSRRNPQSFSELVDLVHALPEVQ